MLNAGLTMQNWFQLSFKQSTYGISPVPFEASLHSSFLSSCITFYYSYLSFSCCTLAFTEHPEVTERWDCQNHVDTAVVWLLMLHCWRVTGITAEMTLLRPSGSPLCSHPNQGQISPACKHARTLVSFIKGVWSIILNGYQRLQSRKKR